MPRMRPPYPLAFPGQVVALVRAKHGALHDLALTARWCTRLVMLGRRRIAADGLPESVLAAERLGAVYSILVHLDREAGQPIVQPLARVLP